MFCTAFDGKGVTLRSRNRLQGVFTTVVVRTMSGTLMAMTSLSHLELQSVDVLTDFPERLYGLRLIKQTVTQKLLLVATLWMQWLMLVGALLDSDLI